MVSAETRAGGGPTQRWTLEEPHGHAFLTFDATAETELSREFLVAYGDIQQATGTAAWERDGFHGAEAARGVGVIPPHPRPAG